MAEWTAECGCVFSNGVRDASNCTEGHETLDSNK